MTVADPLFAQWLQAEGLWSVVEEPTLRERWGDTALTSERMTTIALKPDAEAEAARQLGFMGGPVVTEEHALRGEWAAYLGQVITITIDQLGYDAGIEVFVLNVEDDRSTGVSRVTVLRRL